MSRDQEEVLVEVTDELARTFAALADIAEITAMAITQIAERWRESKEVQPR
jgi:hypothetical protein